MVQHAKRLFKAAEPMMCAPRLAQQRIADLFQALQTAQDQEGLYQERDDDTIVKDSSQPRRCRRAMSLDTIRGHALANQQQ